MIYENPLLLCDFKRVYCIADCGSFMALPAGLDDDAVLEIGQRVLGPECESSHLLVEDCGAENAVMTQWSTKTPTHFSAVRFSTSGFMGAWGA